MHSIASATCITHWFITRCTSWLLEEMRRLLKYKVYEKIHESTWTGPVFDCRWVDDLREDENGEPVPLRPTRQLGSTVNTDPDHGKHGLVMPIRLNPLEGTSHWSWPIGSPW